VPRIPVFGTRVLGFFASFASFFGCPSPLIRTFRQSYYHFCPTGYLSILFTLAPGAGDGRRGQTGRFPIVLVALVFHSNAAGVPRVPVFGTRVFGIHFRLIASSSALAASRSWPSRAASDIPLE
jgi:hypothetical protein